MESYLRIEKLLTSSKSLLTTRDISLLLQVDNTRTREELIVRLIDSNILTQLEKGKYMLTKSGVSDFNISQFLYSPSYVSLESALNLYGILSQFPFEISAITLKKSVTKEILGKTYRYTHIQDRLYTSYEKKENYLIATPEKALFDYLYLCTKSLKSESYLDEMDFTKVKKRELAKFTLRVNKSTGAKINKLIEKYL